MDNTLREKLREIVLKYGPGVSRDPKRCKAFLLDYGEGHRREIFVLVAAVEERIPDQLIEAQDDGLDGPLPGLTRRLAYQLAEPRSMELEAAQWAVETWAFALDLPSQDSASAPQTRSETHPAPPAPPTAQNSPPKAVNAAPRAVSAPNSANAPRNFAQPNMPPTKVVPPVVVSPRSPRIHRGGPSQPSARVRVPLTVFTAIATLITCCLLCRVLGIIIAAITSTRPTPTNPTTPLVIPQTPTTPMNGSEISLGNAASVTELEHWGKGKAQEIAYSPDGELLAVATSIGIYLYEAPFENDAQELREVEYIDAGAVAKIAFSPDGTILASGDNHGYVKLWQLDRNTPSPDGAPSDDGTTLRETLKMRTNIFSIAFSPDGTMLAAGDGYGTVSLWRVNYTLLEENAPPGTAQVKKSTLLCELEKHSLPVSSIAFSPDSKMLASGSWDGVINLWEISDNAPTVEGSILRHTLQVGPGYVFDIAFSPNGELLASGSANNNVMLWRVYDGKLWLELKGHSQYVESVAFSPDGTMLASGDWDHTIKLWQISNGALLKTFEGHRDNVKRVLFSPDGTTLASWAKDGVIKFWHVNDETQPSVALESHSGSVSGVAFTDDGEVLTSRFISGTVELWQMHNGEPFENGALLRTITEDAPAASNVAFSPDRTMLAWGLEDGNVRLWRESDAMIPRRLGKHDDSVHSVAFSPDGTLLATGSDDGIVKLWAISSGTLLRTLDESRGSVNSITFSPDSITLATGDSYGVVRLWRVYDGKLLRRIDGNSDIHSLAFSPDGTMLAAGCKSDVKIWDVSDYALVYTLSGHAQAVLSVAFSLDGVVLASASGDGTVALWRIGDGILLNTLAGHTDGVQHVAFSPDGSMLVTKSKDGTVRLWGLPEQP
ncbi:MAG: WD40 repeat domain-containing protein [Anaerolineae bacterium]|nr:WD40 repeat domain-containing protein [Anaerolineae bacterium]